ncbi:SPFH domain/Band 7 family protein [Streptomyces sp. HB202]|nr:SPFH domain/Band 7 family protein [Streptomyces sp. HB202]
MTGQHENHHPDAPAPDLSIDAPDMPEPQVREVVAHAIPGGLGLLLTVVGVFAGIGLVIGGAVLNGDGSGAVGITLLILGILLVITSFFCMSGVKMVAPGEARVIQLFGRYVGTIRTDGLRWINPLTSSQKISTRVRNHETAVLKVNDAYGNPIELAAIVVWKVEDTAQALFEVDDFLEFVATQTEAAVRHIAIEYPYDAHEEDGLSLRGNAEEITEKLAAELTARVQARGRPDHRVALQPPRVRPRDRLRHAPAPAGRRGRRRPQADRRGRGGHGRDGPAPDRRAGHRGAGLRAEGRHGQQSDGGAVR